MKVNNEEEIILLIKEDEWMMEILTMAKSLNLPDWWVCAGFVRSKIWDVLHGFEERTPIPDIDVIYFDTSNIDEGEEKKVEERLRIINAHIPWSVKNEARMHVVNDIPPYTSSVDAISKFPETATALGIKLDENDEVILTAPCGIEDVLKMQLKPSPYFLETKELAAIYEDRVIQKNWKATWEKITIVHIDK